VRGNEIEVVVVGVVVVVVVVVVLYNRDIKFCSGKMCFMRYA
jgi:hypothetical protein